MTLTRRAWLVVVPALLASACGPTPPPQSPASPNTLVVLAADPESGEVGRLDVSNPSGATALTVVNESTTIVTGRAPAIPVPMSDADIQRLFGAALAVMPPAARQFNLYFELGGDTLTAESQALLAEVIAAVRGRVAPDVSVIGHTDTSGTAESNIALGLRRAGLIRDLLIQAGLDPAVVDVVSHGESDLLVRTPDGIAEARNRRVEVTVR